MKKSDGQLLIAKSDIEICINPKMANRHGLITGATGTGKTVSLQVLAESFSSIGVPVFMTDIKGDLSGVAVSGEGNANVAKRVEKMGLENFEHRGFPVTFWDVYGEKGHPLRTTISEMGPLLLSRLLNLNDIQSSLLTIVFKIADDEGLLLLDLKDLQKLCEYISVNRKDYSQQYGNISPSSIGAIVRELITLGEHGGNLFFGEPAINIFDFIKTDHNGYGMLNILDAQRLMMSPRIYATMLLYLLSELFEQLPEVGDMDKPRLVFFFDEAHILFDEAPKVLLEKIEQVVRLIRSKGVGVYFVTQNPIDIPDTVLGQLGNKIQHALRAYTPRDQKAVKVAAETFRQNPKYDIFEVITQLGVGEALVSFLDEKGVPNMVEQAKILPPQGQIGPISDSQRDEIIKRSMLFGMYDKAIDRESAYEILTQNMEKAMELKEQEELRKEEEKLKKQEEKERSAASKKSSSKSLEKSIVTDITKSVRRSVTNQIGSRIGHSIVRGILGGISKR